MIEAASEVLAANPYHAASTVRKMNRTEGYSKDLAYIHDVGFGMFARDSAAGILEVLHRGGIDEGQVVDFGCGGGIWARRLVDAGIDVNGVDISASMIAIARRRVAEAEFHVESFLKFNIPPCRAVTSLGEVFNYLFDPRHNAASLRRVCQRVFAALQPGGLFIFDVAEPGRGRAPSLRRSNSVGDDWAVFVEMEEDASHRTLTRRITSFRQSGKTYRRHDETHRLQLYRASDVAEMLREIGFRVRIARRYGDYELPKSLVGFIARKP